MDGISGDVTKSRSDNDVAERVPAQVPRSSTEALAEKDNFDSQAKCPSPSLKPRAPPRKPAPANATPTMKRFANEPAEPIIDLKTAPIESMEQYVADLKKVLGLTGNNSVEKLLREVNDKICREFTRDGHRTKAEGLAEKIALIKLLDTELQNITDAQAERQREYDELAHKKELFSPPGDVVVNICVTEKGKEPVNATVRFFDNPLELAKENNKRLLLGLSALPATFLKGAMINYLSTELSGTQVALLKLTERAQEFKSALSDLEKEKSGDIVITLDAIKVFNAKIVILKKWESAFAKRKKAPAEPVAPKKSDAQQTDPLERSQAFRIGQRSFEGLARLIV